MSMVEEDYTSDSDEDSSVDEGVNNVVTHACMCVPSVEFSLQMQTILLWG